MSERLSGPKKPDRQIRKSLAALTLTGVIFGTGGSEGSHVLEHPPVPASTAVVPAPQNTCKPMNRNHITGRAEHMQKVIKDKQMGMGSTERLGPTYWAQVFGVTLLDTQPYINQMAATSNVRKQLAIANGMTQKKFGFSITVADYSNPNDISWDLGAMTRQLADIPVGLVHATDIDTVTLESPEPGRMAPPAGAYATLGTNVPNTITIGPAGALGFTHEFNHHIQAAFLETHCSPLVNYDDPQLSALNPPGFTYSGYNNEPRNWENVTVEPHGAKSVQEDHAVLGNMLHEQVTDFCNKVAASDIIALKTGMVVERMNMLAPHAGDYAMNYFLERCPTTTG